MFWIIIDTTILGHCDEREKILWSFDKESAYNTTCFTELSQRLDEVTQLLTIQLLALIIE